MIKAAGQCFGTAPPQQPEGTTCRSYTQLEYDLARQLGKPVYVFITDDAFPTEPHTAEEEEHSRLQAAHRQALMQTGRDHCRAISPEEIDQKVRSLPLKEEILTAESTRTGDRVVTTVRRLKWWLVPILVVVLGTPIYLRWQGEQQRQNSDLAAQLVKAHEREVGDFRNREQDYQQQLRALTEAVTALTKQKGFDIAEALAQLRENNTGAAEAIFETILEHKVAEGQAAYQQAAEAARHLGALAFLHDTQKALTAYRRAVDLDPGNVGGWNQLGHLLVRVGRLDEAVDAYNRVRALGAERGNQGTLAMAYSNLGNTYFARGNLAQAEDMYRKGLALHEALGQKQSIATAYGNLGSVYGMRGDLAQVEAMHRKALSLNEVLNQATQHWHTESARTHAISVCPGHRVYESRVE
jgi:tetratricopeptide (TPR) repeat protein